MKKQILPGKTLTMIQSLVCLALVVVICCVSFGTFFSVTLTVDDEMEEDIMDLLEEINDGPITDVEIPEEVDVSLLFLLKSVGTTVKTVSALISGGDDSDSNYGEEVSLVNQDTVNFVAFIVAIGQSFAENILLGLAHISLFFLALIFPIINICVLLRRKKQGKTEG